MTWCVYFTHCIVRCDIFNVKCMIFVFVWDICRTLPKKLWKRGVARPRSRILGLLLVLLWKLSRRRDLRNLRFEMLLERLPFGVYPWLSPHWDSFVVISYWMAYSFVYHSPYISSDYLNVLMQWGKGEDQEDKGWEEGEEGWSDGQDTKSTRKRKCS